MNNKITITKELCDDIIDSLKECNLDSASKSLKELELLNKKYENVLQEKELKIKKKLRLFGIFIQELEKWNKEHSSKSELSMIKIHKLLFFACAAHYPMLSIFDNFVAMPYGQVENDLYYSKNKDLEYYRTSYKEDREIDNKIIKQAVKELRERNPDLVCMEAFDLVELSHKWESWIYFYNQAQT